MIFEIIFVYPNHFSDVNRASISYMIKLIEPKLLEHNKIHTEYEKISSFIDLDVQENSELKSLGSDFVDILERKNKIIDTYNQTAHMLDRIKNVIKGIYVDYHKLKGSDVSQNLQQLDELIINYNNETLINFILGMVHDDNI